MNAATLAAILTKNADLEFFSGEEFLIQSPGAIPVPKDGFASADPTIVKAMKEFSHPAQEKNSPVDLNRAIQSTITVASKRVEVCGRTGHRFRR